MMEKNGFLKKHYEMCLQMKPLVFLDYFKEQQHTPSFVKRRQILLKNKNLFLKIYQTAII